MKRQTDMIDRIKAVQAARGMSMTQLAVKVDTPYPTLQRYLAGERRMPVETFMAIASALEISADWLLFGRPAPLELEKLAKALEAHDNLRQVSGAKLSWLDYAKIFAKSYDDWNRPQLLDLVKEELASRGIKLTERKKSRRRKS